MRLLAVCLLALCLRPRPATSLVPLAPAASAPLLLLPPLASECLAGYVGGVAKQGVNHPFELIATMAEARRGRRRGGDGHDEEEPGSAGQSGVPFGHLARHPVRWARRRPTTARRARPTPITAHTPTATTADTTHRNYHLHHLHHTPTYPTSTSSTAGSAPPRR